MNIVVDRFTSDSESTISRVSVDDRFVCFGLEDEHRTFKVPGDTRIPAGKYQVTHSLSVVPSTTGSDHFCCY